MICTAFISNQLYDFSSIMFQYKLVFILELYIAELMFGSMLKKRRYFILRACGVGVALFGIAFALPIAFYSSWYVTVLFLGMFAVSLAFLMLLYDESFGKIFTCGIFAYSLQHIAYSVGSYISNMINDEFYSVYADRSFSVADIRSMVISLVAFIVFYGVMLVLLVRYSGKMREMTINNLTLIIIGAVMIVASVVMNAIVVYEFSSGYSKALLTVYFIYDIVSAVMVMALLCFAISNSRIRNELQIMNILREKDRQVYSIKKSKIDTINILCHDLKHQIYNLRKGAHDELVLASMERSIDAYSDIYKTGNEILDTILSENSLYCANYGIRLICMADGAALRDVPESALYSIFDNLLNNAVEAARFADGDKKVIKVIVARSLADTVNICVENPYDNRELEFEEGLPKSTKTGLSHGYGLRSVQAEIDALGGAMSINAHDGVFKVTAVLSLHPVND